MPCLPLAQPAAPSQGAFARERRSFPRRPGQRRPCVPIAARIRARASSRCGGCNRDGHSVLGNSQIRPLLQTDHSEVQLLRHSSCRRRIGLVVLPAPRIRRGLRTVAAKVQLRIVSSGRCDRRSRSLAPRTLAGPCSLETAPPAVGQQHVDRTLLLLDELIHLHVDCERLQPRACDCDRLPQPMAPTNKRLCSHVGTLLTAACADVHASAVCFHRRRMQHRSCAWLYCVAAACSATPCRQRTCPPPGTHHRASTAGR